NGVEPQEVIDQYGSDTARLFVMFASPPEQTLEWSSTGVEGAMRFLRRIWHFAAEHADTIRSAPATVDADRLGAAQRDLRRAIHTVLRQADYDYQRTQYNTVVSAAMKMLNAIEDATHDGTPESAAVLRESLSILLRILYPVVPHITHAIWTELGYAKAWGDLLDAPWPEVDPQALVLDEVELVLQINGKVRGSIRVAADADREAIQAAALASDAYARHGEGKPVRKLIVVPGRLVNLVV